MNYFHKFCGVSMRLRCIRDQASMPSWWGSAIRPVPSGWEVRRFHRHGKNPLEDLAALRNVRMVVARGKRYADQGKDEMPEVGQALDPVYLG